MKVPEMRCYGKSDSRGGFTLLEMLIVIVIIIVLMGVVFKLSKGAMVNAERAKEIARVSMLMSLAEEFHAEYGIYPPVPEYDGAQPFNFNGAYPTDGADLIYYISHYNEYCFTFGFMSFFVDRPSYGQKTFDVAGKKGNKDATAAWEGYNDEVPDNAELTSSSKDKAFVKRVKPILDKIGVNGPGAELDAKDHTMGFHTSVLDTWEREYVYISEPPYTSYVLFCKGADGQYDASAPEDRSKPKNKDNIYADIGGK